MAGEEKLETNVTENGVQKVYSRRYLKQKQEMLEAANAAKTKAPAAATQTAPKPADKPK